jgi:hypothetical protein
LLDCCAEILRWGGVSARNGWYLREHANIIEVELRHLSGVLTSDRTPSAIAMRREATDPETECRMNAGFVTIYSLLLDYCVIYDGRFGAALGLLARQFCEATGRDRVPPRARTALSRERLTDVNYFCRPANLIVVDHTRASQGLIDRSTAVVSDRAWS